MLKAAIDIGTNTSHLIIASISKGKIEHILYRKRYYTYIAHDGIGCISPSAEGRLLEAIKNFKYQITQYKVTQVKAVGTEALRQAENGAEILNKIADRYSIDVEIISGNREAELIHAGASMAISMYNNNYLIVDIGGGSVEFIYALGGEIEWLHSLPIGIARLYKTFHNAEPIRIDMIKALEDHLQEQCNHIFSRISEDYQLIGSAGTFETLVQTDLVSTTHTELDKISFEKIYGELIGQDEKKRAKHPSIRVERAKYIIVALLLIKYLFSATGQEKIIVSKYALKEGLLVAQ